MAAQPWQSIRNASPNTRPDPAALVDGQIALNTAAASAAVYFKAADGTLAKAGVAQLSTTAPNSTPGGFAGNTKGEFWYDTSTSQLKLYDGGAWITASSNYVLPPATQTVLGGVKIGDGLQIAADGTLSLDFAVAEVKGSADPTKAPPALTANDAGNVYIASATGNAAAGWTGIVGEMVYEADLMIWDGTAWFHKEQNLEGAVVSVTGTSPIVVGGTAAEPVISIKPATVSSIGAISVGTGLIVDAGGKLSLDADEGTY
jgi:hypothetical protein